MGGVSPVDMQVMITKSVEVAKQYGQEIHKGVATQKNIVEDEQRLQEENLKKVHEKNSTEKIYSTDEEDKGKNNSNQELDYEKEEETSEEVEEREEKGKKKYEGVMGHFDMKI